MALANVIKPRGFDMNEDIRCEVLFQTFIKDMNKLKKKITDSDYERQLEDEVGLVCPFERPFITNYEDRRGR